MNVYIVTQKSPSVDYYWIVSYTSPQGAKSFVVNEELDVDYDNLEVEELQGVQHPSPIPLIIWTNY